MKIKILFIAILILFNSCKDSNNTSMVEEESVIESTDELLLRLQPKIGKATLRTMAIEITPNGIVPLKTQSIIDLKLLPSQWVDQNIKYNIDFQRIRMEVGVLNQNINYDSRGDNKNVPDQIQQQVKKVLSKSVTIGLNPFGEVIGLEYDGDKKMLEKNAINLSFLFVPFPDHSIEVGEEWVVSQIIYDNKLDITYKVKELDKDNVVIVVVSNSNNEAQIQGEYLVKKKTGEVETGHLEIKTDKEIGQVNIDIGPTVQ